MRTKASAIGRAGRKRKLAPDPFDRIAAALERIAGAQEKFSDGQQAALEMLGETIGDLLRGIFSEPEAGRQKPF